MNLNSTNSYGVSVQESLDPPASDGTALPHALNLPAFTVCVLLYGDYPELAMRCLSSIRALALDGSVALRIGANAISARTKMAVRQLGLEGFMHVQSEENLKKYPMMKRLFQKTDAQPEAGAGVPPPFTMWFDDDSYLTAADPHAWLNGVAHAMESADLIGSIYTMRLKAGQHSWIERQPWYAGQPVCPGHQVAFCTGGWWTIRTELLERFNWPVPELLHRGGDVMLGELCRQQGLRMKNFLHGVAINADLQGQQGKSPRRGFDSPPVGYEG